MHIVKNPIDISAHHRNSLRTTFKNTLNTWHSSGSAEVIRLTDLEPTLERPRLQSSPGIPPGRLADQLSEHRRSRSPRRRPECWRRPACCSATTRATVTATGTATTTTTTTATATAASRALRRCSRAPRGDRPRMTTCAPGHREHAEAQATAQEQPQRTTKLARMTYCNFLLQVFSRVPSALLNFSLLNFSPNFSHNFTEFFT